MSLGLADVTGAADAWWSGAAEAGGENCVCNFGIEVVGIEVFTQPLTSLGVLWMSRIGENFEQFKVAPGTATILGRTPALCGGTGGTGQSLNDGQALFDQEHMFPVVTEVVGVGEAGDARVDQTVQGDAFLVGDIVDGTRITVLPALNVECVEMVVFPSHGGLDRAMQVTERRLTGNQEPAPDRWFRVAQRHLQADRVSVDVALRLGGSGHHGLLPSRPASTASCMSYPVRDGAMESKRVHAAVGRGCPLRVRGRAWRRPPPRRRALSGTERSSG